MIIYKDALSGDELFSDQFPIKEECDGILLKVEAKYEQEEAGFDTSNMAGFNASQEEAAEEVQDGVVTVLNLPHRHQYGETQFGTKKEYQTYIKGYMKRLKEYLEANDPDKVEGFMKGAPNAVKHLLSLFKDAKFYVGTSMDYDAMIPVLHYEQGEGDEKCMFYFFKHGLTEDKV